MDQAESLCDGKAIRYNGNSLHRYVTVTVSTIPDRKSKRHENLSGIVETKYYYRVMPLFENKTV